MHIAAATELGWISTKTDDGVHQNWFHFVTGGGSEDKNENPVDAMDFHRFKVDGCDDSIETLIDENDTGAYPANGDETYNDYRDLAETAVTSAFSLLGMTSASLEAAKEIQDVFGKDQNCSNYIKERQANRHKRWDMAKQSRVATQGEFMLEWPKNEDGWVKFESELRGSRSMWCNGSNSSSNAKVTNDFYIWCDSDGSCTMYT